jgi:tetratricopeptide (TPR) repeat protein
MSSDPLPPSLIQDLWDRRFFQYVGTYLGVCFGLVQFAEFIEGRYGLENNLVEKVFIFLAIMLPAVALYIYNHGRKGHDAWLPIEKFFIPTSLVMALGCSFFLFNRAEKTTEKVSITTEAGETITRMVPTAATAKRLVIFPFEHNLEQKDQWLSLAAPFLLNKELQQDMRTYAIQPFQLKDEFESYKLEFAQAVPFASRIKIAQDNYTDYFISGRLSEKQGQLQLIGEVHESNNGKLFFSDTIAAGSIYALVDEFASAFNEHLYVKDAKPGTEMIDLPSKDLVTPDLEALQHLIQANFMRVQGPATIASGIAEAEKSVLLDPRCAECYATLANLYLGASKEVESNQAIDKALANATALPERQKLMIGFLNYIMHEQLDKGRLLLQNWQKLYPNDLTPYSQLIALYRRTQEIGKAKDVALTAVENGHRGKILMDLAQMYIDTEDFGEAERYMEEFSTLYPHKAKERSLLGEIYMQRGDLEKAKAFYRDLSIVQANEPAFLLKLADVSDRLGEFSESEELFDRALRLAQRAQDSIAVYESMEGHYERLGQFNRLFDILELRESLMEKTAPPIVVKPQIVFNTWPRFMVSKRESEYHRRIDELLQLLPERASILRCVADFLFNMGTENLAGYEATPDECRQYIIQSSGKNFEIVYTAALAELRGNYREAAEGYEAYADSTGQNDKRFSTGLSKMYRLSDQVEKAATLMDRNLATDPNQPVFLLERARVSKAQGDIDQAKEWLDKALRIWENADPEYQNFEEALVFEKELQESIN